MSVVRQSPPPLRHDDVDDAGLSVGDVSPLWLRRHRLLPVSRGALAYRIRAHACGARRHAQGRARYRMQPLNADGAAAPGGTSAASVVAEGSQWVARAATGGPLVMNPPLQRRSTRQPCL